MQDRGEATPLVEDIGAINDTPQVSDQKVVKRSRRRGSTWAVVAGVTVVGGIILSTALIQSPPSPPSPVEPEQQPTHVQCATRNPPTQIMGMDPDQWEENQKDYEAEVGYSLAYCTVAPLPVSGAIVEPVTACEAVGGRPTTWPKDEYPALLRERPALPRGQRIVAVTNLEEQTTTEIGIALPSALIELCGPLDWSYQHEGQTVTQAIPANEELGTLPEGRHFVYEPTPEGNLELRGVENRYGFLLPLPEAPTTQTQPADEE